MCLNKTTPVMVAELDGMNELVGMVAVDIDSCIANIVRVLNANGIFTVTCCCGHGSRKGSIILADGRILELSIAQMEIDMNPKEAHDICDKRKCTGGAFCNENPNTCIKAKRIELPQQLRRCDKINCEGHGGKRHCEDSMGCNDQFVYDHSQPNTTKE